MQWMEKVTDEQYNGALPAPPQNSARPSGELQQRIAPGLATLTDDVLYGDVWQRPELSPRDRSLVTISVLIATGKTAQLTGHLTRGLANGIKPIEASALLAHLAIYSGWPNAVSALEVYDHRCTRRGTSIRAVSARSVRGFSARIRTGMGQSDRRRIGKRRTEARPADQPCGLRDATTTSSMSRCAAESRWSDPRADCRGVDAHGLLCRLAQTPIHIRSVRSSAHCQAVGLTGSVCGTRKEK